MRIAGGRLRGRRLAAPGGRAVRPTAERVRQALFNLLMHGPYGGPEGPMPLGRDVLDAFAGTGALGLEALSRGARFVTFLERDGAALALLRENVAALAAPGEAAVTPCDAGRPGPAPRQHALALLDPPYRSGLAAPALAALAAAGWLTEDAVAVVELARGEAFTPPDGFARADERRYGATRLVILRRR